MRARVCRWSEPAQVTFGITVLTANQGVDVSHGRVTKPFELFPALFDEVPATMLRSPVMISIDRPPARDQLRFYQHRVLTLQLAGNASSFVENMFVKVPLKKSGVFFRILEVNAEDESLIARLELINLYVWEGAPVHWEMR